MNRERWMKTRMRLKADEANRRVLSMIPGGRIALVSQERRREILEEGLLDTLVSTRVERTPDRVTRSATGIDEDNRESD